MPTRQALYFLSHYTSPPVGFLMLSWLLKAEFCSELENQSTDSSLGQTCMAQVYPKSKQIRSSFWTEVKFFPSVIIFQKLKEAMFFVLKVLIIISNLISDASTAIIKGFEKSEASKIDKEIKAYLNF
jgi:hypothetical protein